MDQFGLNAECLKLDSNREIKKEFDFLQCDSLQPDSPFLSTTLANPLGDESLNDRMPLDLSNLKDLSSICKLNLTKNETPYSIRYKLQDGKHLKVWECKTCSKEFNHQYTLMRHLPTHTDERRFRCNTCGKAFRQMSTLSQHKAIHSHERPYVCEVCQKTFNRVSTLISHRKTHSDNKPHRCHLCDKAFHQKGNLRNHIFTHTNERPYRCDDCGKGFNQMSNLMCHKIKTHQRMDKPKHVCQTCDKAFDKRIALRNHEQYEHQKGNQVIKPLFIDESIPKINNAVIIEPINTKAMQLALETNHIPFALLRPSSGIPVFVRVLPAGRCYKQVLVPASAEDLKEHGEISVTSNTTTNPRTNNILTILKTEDNNANLVGSTVQITLPVVATVVEQNEQDSQVSTSVGSPEPAELIKQPNCQSLGTYILTAPNEEKSDVLDREENLKIDLYGQNDATDPFHIDFSEIKENVNAEEDMLIIS